MKVSLSITICVFIALSDSLWAELDQSNVALDPVLTESTQSIAELNQPLPV
ncbi:MAG: hypothetical protein ACJAUA_001303, partial [Zhongshania aliphaticivorans]